MRIAIAVLMSLAAAAAPALAQSPDERARAQKHFEVAELHFGDGEYEQAIEQYRKAHALSREPVLLFNVGLCFEKLGKTAEAIESYNAYLAADPKGAKAGEARYRVEKLSEELATAKEKGTVDKPAETGTPAAAALTLRLARDQGTFKISLLAAGEIKLECPPTTFVTPCVLSDVPPGPARLTVEHGGDRATATFEAPAGPATRRIAFKPLVRGYKNVFLVAGIGALAASAASFVGAGVAGTGSGAFPVLLVSGGVLLVGGFAGVTFGAVGIGGSTTPASVSIR